MNKKVRFSLNLTPQKQNSIHRIFLVLDKLQKWFDFKFISQSFSRLALQKRKNVQKFICVEAIHKRIVQQVFLTLKLYQKRVLNTEKSIKSIRKLSISILAQFLHKKVSQQKIYTFQKLSAFKMNKKSLQKNTFFQNMIKVSNNFKKKVLLSESFKKLKKISLNVKKLHTFFKTLDMLVLKTQQQNLEQSFSFMLCEGFSKMHSTNIKQRQEKITESKNLQLSKNEKYRLIRIEINALEKTLQFEESSKTKSKKEDFDRNLILQAKNAHKERSAQQLRKITFQNESLNHQLHKKKGYVKIEDESKALAEKAQSRFRKIYDLLKASKTKQSMSFKELSIMLGRENVDLAQILKKFGLSKQSLILENIDLKNLQNLYQRQILGCGMGTNITESEAYRKTMQQNMNLRELLQILVARMIQGQQQQINLQKEELNRLVQKYHNQQKGSKVTVTTLSSSLYSFTQ